MLSNCPLCAFFFASHFYCETKLLCSPEQTGGPERMLFFIISTQAALVATLIYRVQDATNWTVEIGYSHQNSSMYEYYARRTRNDDMYAVCVRRWAKEKIGRHVWTEKASHASEAFCWIFDGFSERAQIEWSTGSGAIIYSHGSWITRCVDDCQVLRQNRMFSLLRASSVDETVLKW